MSSNPHNYGLINLYAKLAKKIVHSPNRIKGVSINNLNIKPNKSISQNNKTLDDFLSLYNPNNNVKKSNSNKNISRNNFKNNSKNVFLNKKQNEDYFLNKKRKFKSKEEEEEFNREMEASKEIDKMLEEVRKEKRVKLLEQQKNNEVKAEENKNIKKTEKKNNKNKNNFFLDALGLTEEEIQKSNEEQKIKEEKEKNNEQKINELMNSGNKINLDNSIISKTNKDKIPKYYTYKVSREDIYKKVLSFKFYNTKLKTEIIPDYFENELHYRYIWIDNFLNELKYCLLNEKAESSDIQNYKEIDLKVKLIYISQEFPNIDSFQIIPNKNLKDYKKKILKDNDIIAIYSENEKINFEDITISNKNNLNYFLGIIKRELDSYELKVLIHSNNSDKFKLISNNYNSKLNKEELFNIKYLNNINSSYREFKALLYLELSNFKDILNPKNLSLKYNEISNNSNNNGLETKESIFLNNIKNSGIYNISQIEVLKKANKMQKNEVLLIQGPPGTGKTHTILGLTSLFRLNKNRKILICTQSNTAIDEICIRLINKGIYDEKLNKVNANFLRYGYLERRDKEKKYLFTEQGKLLEKNSLDYLIDLKFKEKLENALIEKDKLIKEINKLSLDKEKNIEQIKSLENQKQLLLLNLNKNKFEKQSYENHLLSNIPILCTTLNNAGNEKLKKCNISFDVLIIDEACQCVEPSSLIPLCHGIKKLILVGDHKQLPATVFYPKAKSILYNRSLFERLINNNIPRHILTIQYRMQTNIRQFISSIFYENKLMDSPDINYISKINNNDFYKIININKNFYFFDLNFSEENFDGIIKSYYNIQEIDFSFLLMKKINNSLEHNRYKNNEYKYAIITPYQAQVKKFKEKIYKYEDLSDIDIRINTVDSFQGQERDIIFFSTVRSNNKLSLSINNGDGESIGFLNDYRRMNVGLSRAKLGCFIIGNSQKLKIDHYWEKLIEFCKDKKCFYKIDSINQYNQAMESIFLKK